MVSRKDISLSDILSCSVCYDIYEDPVVLRCGHEFCKKCITKCSGQKCPLCQKVFEKQDLVAAYKTKEMCDNLVTLRAGGDKKPDVSTLCRRHDHERANWICLPCQEGVCGHCLYEKKHEGGGHKLEKLSEAYLSINSEKEQYLKILRRLLESSEQQREIELQVLGDLEAIMARKILQVRYDTLSVISEYESKMLNLIRNWSPAVKLEPLLDQGKELLILDQSSKTEKTQASSNLVVQELKQKFDIKKAVSAIEIALAKAEQSTNDDICKFQNEHVRIFNDLQHGVEIQVNELKDSFSLIYTKLRENFIRERPVEEDMRSNPVIQIEGCSLEGDHFLTNQDKGHYDLKFNLFSVTGHGLHCVKEVSKRGLTIMLVSLQTGEAIKSFFYRFFGELAVLLARKVPRVQSMSCRESGTEFVYAIGREDMSDADAIPCVVDIFSWDGKGQLMTTFRLSMKNVRCALFGFDGELIYLTNEENRMEIRITEAANPTESRRVCPIREHELPSTTPTILCHDKLNNRVFVNTWDGRILIASTNIEDVHYVKLGFLDNIFSLAVNKVGQVAIMGTYWNTKEYETQLVLLGNSDSEVRRWNASGIKLRNKEDKLINMVSTDDKLVFMVKGKGGNKYYFIIFEDLFQKELV